MAKIIKFHATLLTKPHTIITDNIYKGGKRMKKRITAIIICVSVILMISFIVLIIHRSITDRSNYNSEAYDDFIYTDDVYYEPMDEDTPNKDAYYEFSIDDIVAEHKKIDPSEYDKQDNENLVSALASSSPLLHAESYDDFYAVILHSYNRYNNADATTLESNTTGEGILTDHTEDDDSVSVPLDHYISLTSNPYFDEGNTVLTEDTYIYSPLNPEYIIEPDIIKLPILSISQLRVENGRLSKATKIMLRPSSDRTGTLEYQFKELYLYKNMLAVAYQIKAFDDNAESFTVTSYIDFYDVTDKHTPEKINTLVQDGYYEKLAVNNGMLYAVSRFNPAAAPDSYKITELDRYIPNINGKPISPDSLFYSGHLYKPNIYMVTCTELDGDAKLTDSKAFCCSDSKLYWGNDSMILYSNIYDAIEKTEVIGIKFSNGEISSGNRGVVAGYMSDPYAISEYNGRLRIATTIPADDMSRYDGKLRKADSRITDTAYNEDHLTMYVLDSELSLSGRLSDMLPYDSICSITYIGDTAYIKNKNPNDEKMHLIDLSDPHNIHAIGWSELPDFFVQLYPFGDDLLLGMNSPLYPEDTKVGYYNGHKLAMYDISNTSSISLLHEYDPPEDLCDCCVMYDHTALMMDTENNYIGFCNKAYDYDGQGEYTPCWRYSTYTYDNISGFVKLQDYDIDAAGDYDINESDIDVIRGFFAGDYFYLVTPDFIESYKIVELSVNEYIYFYN